MWTLNTHTDIAHTPTIAFVSLKLVVLIKLNLKSYCFLSNSSQQDRMFNHLIDDLFNERKKSSSL